MWIPSKLTRPGRLHNAIVRPRVLDLLQQAPCYKLVLFRSPAGYGKTTMAAQWLSDKPNVGWYSIDDSDNDDFRFVNYLLQALNKATHSSCSNAQKEHQIVRPHRGNQRRQTLGLRARQKGLSG